MKRQLFNRLIILMSSVILFSCNDEIMPQEEDITMPQEYYDIETIRTPDSEEAGLLTSFINRAESLNLTSGKYDHSYQSAEVVEYTGLEGKAIVAGYSGGESKDGVENSLILVADEENNELTHYEHIRKDKGQVYEVQIYQEGKKWLVSTVDKETGEVLELIYSSYNKEEEADDEEMSFSECAKMAIDSCVEDNSCTFMCAVLWKHCLGAIALACFLVTI